MSHTVEEDVKVQPAQVPGWVPRLAIISGLLALLCFIATPLLPVSQTQSSFSWPQNDSLNSVNAPLISVAPESFEATVPIAALEMLNEGENTLLSTVPPTSPRAPERGLFVRGGADAGLDVVSLSDVLFSLSAQQVADLDEDAAVHISATGDGTLVEIPGTKYREESEEDYRPQVSGIYTEIADTPANLAALGSLRADVEINSRFTSTPTALKLITMVAGIILTLLSLYALWRMDASRAGADTRRQWLNFSRLDALVVGVIAFWYIFGANTSDDGFTATMARVSNNAGYMANYYRWYGVPESPFGSPYYDLLAFIAQFSTSSVAMRLPSLLAALLIWWIVSRELLPRFGKTLASHRLAYWTAAMVFLAFWLPYNNGTRPEPMVAVGAVAAWALFERAITTRRLFPGAIGTVIAAFTLTIGPTGLLAVGAFLVALPQLFAILKERNYPSTLAALAPFFGAGTAVLVPVFADQTLAAVVESTRVRSLVGPALDWWTEYIRYAILFQETVDGSLTRRFAMLAMLISLLIIGWALIRGRGLPADIPQGIVVRLLAIMGLSFFFLMFTPTKWTHHFGIYAGMGAVIAALAGVLLSYLVTRSPAARTWVWAGTTALAAITFAGWNAWWYVSSFGIPWWDKIPQFKGVEFTTLILVAALVIAGVGGWQYYRGHTQPVVGDTRFNRLASAPLAILSGLIVLSAVLSFTKAFIDQYPAYTVGLGNVRTLAGNQCALSNDVMMETNTNDAFLTPVGDASLGESLEVNDPEGFGPKGVPSSIFDEDETVDNGTSSSGGSSASSSTSDSTSGTSGTSGTVGTAGSASTDAGTDSTTTDSASDGTTDSSESEESTKGERKEKGINGSTARLPFNLDFRRVPVVGSWTEETQRAAEITTAWYHLPEATDTAPLITLSVAGRINHHDANGVEQPGETLLLEYGRVRDNGSVERLGEQEMMDIGPVTSWRNLRYPIAALPEEADAVRIVAEDTSLNPVDWIALTPPRVPELSPLSEQISPETPTLLDWSVGLQFPCQRSFDHYAGVSEIPEYRIAPDHPGRASLTGFMDFYGGGALATVQAVTERYEIPAYAKDDPHRDWGSVHRYQLRTNSQGVKPDLAQIHTEEIIRTGWWHPSDMKIREIED